MKLTIEDHNHMAEAYHVGSVGYQRLVDKELWPFLKAINPTTEFQEGIIGLYGRFHLWMGSAATLATPDHFQAVRAAARSGFELLLDIKRIVDDPVKVTMMNDFTSVARFKSALKMEQFFVEHPTLNPKRFRHQLSLVNDPEARRNYDALIKRHWPRQAPKPPQHWSGRNARERAEDAGSDYLFIYVEEYELNSWFIHSGASATADVPAEGLVNAYVRGQSLIQQMYHEATVIVADSFSFGDVKPEFAARLAEINSLPDRLLSEEFHAKLERINKAGR